MALLLAGASWLGCSSSSSTPDAGGGTGGVVLGGRGGGTGGGGIGGGGGLGGFGGVLGGAGVGGLGGSIANDGGVIDGAVRDGAFDGAVDGASDGASPDLAPPLTANRPDRRDVSPALIQQLRVPAGFRVSVYATGVTDARMLALGPSGAVYVTTPMSGQVVRLKDANGDGDVDDANERTVVASAMTNPDLEGVHGITFSQGAVYLASIKHVLSASVGEDGSFGALKTLVSDLPDGGQHPNRTIGVGPDGKLYVSVGSDCNNCRESNSEHATLLRLNLDGTAATNAANPQHPMLAANPLSKISPRVWASGLRNTIGFAWHPTTQDLWGIDQGSDGLGEDTPPEELNRLMEGRSYGWPYCWGDKQPDPTVDEPSQALTKQTYCPTTASPLAGLPAHSSPIAFVFYTGAQFPAAYHNDGLLVLRGSWGRAIPDGYKVVRLHFVNGVPAPLPGNAPNDNTWYDDFLAGFLIENGAAHFGRIAGLTIDADGSVLVSDDTNGMIYRVSYGAAGADAGTADSGASRADGAVD